jgi:hypothetical protein
MGHRTGGSCTGRHDEFRESLKGQYDVAIRDYDVAISKQPDCRAELVKPG